MSEEKGDKFLIEKWFNSVLEKANEELFKSFTEKKGSWKDATPMFLFEKMKKHVGFLENCICGIAPNHLFASMHVSHVLNYALMIATRIEMIREEADGTYELLAELEFPPLHDNTRILDSDKDESC